MKRPPSYGQHLRIGNMLRSKLDFRMTCLHGASFALTVFGKALVSAPNCGSIFSLSRMPFQVLKEKGRTAGSVVPFCGLRQQMRSRANLADAVSDLSYLQVG